MKKAIAVFLEPGENWDHSKSVREQAFWQEPAQFMTTIPWNEHGILQVAEIREWNIFLDARDQP
ncbi:MAG TPA: hypothetical protein VE863_10305 [Pyrinomonadaceae bacterium]|jgi:hypothetical protein|nr:hypothetical protein [Pyrinomonadaceae bacterium]